MARINVCSSAPLSTQLSVAFLNLESQGLQVQLRPLSELPVAPRPGYRAAALRTELVAVGEELTAIGLVLDEHLLGCRRLSAGDEQGLQFDYDALRSRQRAIEASLRQLKGEQPNG